MGSSFGERLRHERNSHRLTQSELGGGLFAASFIALLEAAEREPTSDDIRKLSHRLLEGQNAQESQIEALRLALTARQDWDTRDYATSAMNALASAAISNEQSPTWWDMHFLAANSLIRNGDLDEATAALTTLLANPITVQRDSLALRAHQVMASAMLAQGNLAGAIHHATLAVEIGSGDSPDEFAAYLLALQTMIGALTEAGRLDEAWMHAQTLAEAVTDEIPEQMAGEIHWVIGNVAFIRQDVREGLEHHAKASRLLSPVNDLSRWAQFNKATAWVRLMAGVVEPATLEAIERSELAHSVVGATPLEFLEVKLLRARWYVLNHQFEEALDLLTGIESKADQLAPHISGDSALLMGDCLEGMGRFDQATHAYERAQERYIQAGALDRAEIAVERMAQIHPADA